MFGTSSRLYEWTLAKYVRFIENNPNPGPEKQKSKIDNSVDEACKYPSVDRGSWQQVLGSVTDPLRLTILNTEHIIVTKGKVPLEHHLMLANAAQMRAAGKGDSIMFMVKVQNEDRRFRVRFPDSKDPVTGKSVCQQCAQVLAKFIAIEYVQSQPPEGAGDKQVPNVSQVARTILNRSAPDALASAYKPAKMTDKELDVAIRQCLADPAFPDFVEQVEKKLNDIAFCPGTRKENDTNAQVADDVQMTTMPDSQMRFF